MGRQASLAAVGSLIPRPLLQLLPLLHFAGGPVGALRHMRIN